MPIQSLAIIVVAAGRGDRFGAPKQWTPLAGHPLLAHCLAAFEAAFPGAERLVVLPPGAGASAEWAACRSSLATEWRVVDGGATRAASVRAGVEAATEEVVAVHDGARPFPPIEAIREGLQIMDLDPSAECAVIASRATDTLKRIDPGTGRIVQTIDRSAIARAETPQICRRAALLAALGRPGAEDCTDEAQAIEAAGGRSVVVLHGGFNPKVTTPPDLRLAEAWLAGGGAAG